MKSLVNLLTGDDSPLPRVVLRILRCLGQDNESFQIEMIESGIIKKTISMIIRKEDEETQHWAIVRIEKIFLL